MTPDATALDAAFAALAGWTWGSDSAALATIDSAVVAAHADAVLRADLERRLVDLLGAGGSRAAKDEACRRLCRVGATASVAALAPLLADPDSSHMARFALERIEGPEAAAALRTAAETLGGPQQQGAISSLAARRDGASVPLMSRLLSADAATGRAAATALGSIGSSGAAAALAAAQDRNPPGTPLGDAIADARLACAESLLASGDRPAALGIMQSLGVAARGNPAARQIELAAARGLLACLDTAAS